MANTVRILRSTTAGAVPASLVSGQIAINEADGKLFYRSAAGVVTQFSAILEYDTPASFPATGKAGVLVVAGDYGRIYRWTGSVYQEIGPVGDSPITWNGVVRDLVFCG